MALGYWLIIIITLILGLSTQAYIKSTYKKYARVPISTGLTGGQMARNMLDWNGLNNIQLGMTGGTLTDNFNPKTGVINLSGEVYNGITVSATAVACHETGHAVQHARGYAPAKFRMSLVPIVSFASNIWMIALFMGLILNILGLVYVGIFLFAFAVLFQLVTLPVEFDASRRALETISGLGIPQEEVAGCRKVLTAAALTYVAAALSSILQLLYFIGLARR